MYGGLDVPPSQCIRYNETENKQKTDCIEVYCQVERGDNCLNCPSDCLYRYEEKLDPLGYASACPGKHNPL